MYSTQVDGGAHVGGFDLVNLNSGRKLRFSFSPVGPVTGMED